MRTFLQKMNYNTKDKKTQNRLLCIKVGCILIVAFIFACLPIETVQAASGIKLYNYTTKKETVYTDKQVKITYNGSQVSLSKTPGILMNGTAMVPYKDVFVKSGIQADFAYNKEKGTVTISKYGTTIKMTINSKNATINGKAVTLPVAPVKIKYVSANITNILVPSRFVSEALGLGYTWYSARNTVEIVKNGLQLSYNDGKIFDYTGSLGLVTANGKGLDLGNMPSVIYNNTAMLRAKKVFAGPEIGAQYSYNSSNKTVTLSKNGNVLVMTIGSSVAYLNGNSINLSQGPIVVKNHDVNTSYVMVPGSVTASCLGYDYAWNKDKLTSIITLSKDDGKQENNGGIDDSASSPELGGVGDIKEKVVVLNQWNSNNALIAKSNGIQSLNLGMPSSANKGFIYAIMRDYSNVKQNTETFTITGISPFEQVTSSQTNQVITLKASNMECVNQTYQMQGNSSNHVKQITTTYNSEDMSTTINMEIIPQHVSYDISLSEDKHSLNVTIYLNSVASAEISSNDEGDYLTLSGVNPLKVAITKQDNMLYVDLLGATNGLGDLYAEITGSKYINLLYVIGVSDKTRVILSLKDGYEYYISEEANQCTISFVSTNIVKPTIPSDVLDKSNSEIVIPKPIGVTSNMISHVDYYNNNRFAIKIAGDHTAFFANNAITLNSSIITNVSVLLNNNNETEIRFSTSCLQGYAFVEDNDNIYVHIGAPREIYKNIVVLDPGHGGPANGAHYFGVKEKDLNLKMLFEIGKNYFNTNPQELKVYYTRTTDVDMTLANRAAFASKIGADLFVSLHMNASTSSSAYGTEVYYSTSNNGANQAGLTSKTMATLFVNNLSNTLGTNNRGAKAQRYTVVHKNTVPAVLLELGFMSNKNDFALITNQKFQEKAVKVIYDTLLQLFKQYPTGR